MELAVFSALGLLLAAFLFCWMIRYVGYRIGSRHFKVTLFGICIRRIPLEHISSVSKRRSDGMAENWWNTLRPNHRTLVIRRQRGWPRNVVITPKNRYVFKTELEKALTRTNSRIHPDNESSSPP
jgi:hypothetical protein